MDSIYLLLGLNEKGLWNILEACDSESTVEFCIEQYKDSFKEYRIIVKPLIITRRYVFTGISDEIPS